jgi:hypothetical protein
MFLAVYTCSMIALGSFACSDDKKNDDTFPTNVGEGGVTSTDSGPATPDSGGDTGGFVGDSGTADVGPCPPSEPLYSAGIEPSCSTCLSAHCCSEVKACEGIEDCKTFLQCYAPCRVDGGAQGSCTSTCIAGKDGGAIQSAFNAVVLCGGNNCNNDGGAAAPKCPF